MDNDAVSLDSRSETERAVRQRTRRARKASQQDTRTTLALMRLNFYFQQFVHDYHGIVDDESFFPRPRHALPVHATIKNAPIFSLADRFPGPSPKSARDLSTSWSFNVARRSDITSPREVTAVLQPRRPKVRRVYKQLDPGPGSYNPATPRPNHCLSMDDVIGRDQDFASAARRSDLGPGAYDPPDVPPTPSYIPRIDRIASRDLPRRSDDAVPGPGAYTPRRIDDRYVPAPKYLTMSPRKIQLAPVSCTTTPGAGSYDVRTTLQRPAPISYSFPVADRHLVDAGNGDAADAKSKASSPGDPVVPFVERNMKVARPEQVRTERSRKAAARKAAYEFVLARGRANHDIAQRQADALQASNEAKALRATWRVTVTALHAAGAMATMITERKEWLENNNGIELRRFQLISTLNKFERIIRQRLLTRRRRRNADLVRRFFKETELLSKSVLVVVLRHFRRAVSTIQTFWRRMQSKIENQVMVFITQWIRSESGGAPSLVPSAKAPAPRKVTITADSEHAGSICERVLDRVAGDEPGTRRSVPNVIKAAVLRSFIVRRRHEFWTRMKQWHAERRAWTSEHETRDTLLEKARQILQGISSNDTETSASFRAAHPKPHLRLVLSAEDISLLVRQAHIEQGKLSIRDKRRVRVRAPSARLEQIQ